MTEPNVSTEWLETDGLGGFASGTVSGIATRGYHSLLNVALTPPTSRTVLVNSCEVTVHTESSTYALSSHQYAPDNTHPDGYKRLKQFDHLPWPRWTYELEDKTVITQELFMVHGAPITCMRWSLESATEQDVHLDMCPLLSGRDHHSLHQKNNEFLFESFEHGDHIIWRPYKHLPAIVALSNGTYEHRPDWYEQFLYVREKQRGLACQEDLASPGCFSWNLQNGDAIWIVAPDGYEDMLHTEDYTPLERFMEFADQEFERRNTFASPLQQAGDAYIVERDEGKTIIAGYPWFTDWGRDTFIAMRGLCLATKRYDDAEQILLAWAKTVNEGMLPNRFIDQEEEPEYNSVDASLWYVIAVHDFLEKAPDVSMQTEDTLMKAVQSILLGYKHGTRYGIHLDDDGLIACGEPGVQLTWMDAKVDDWVVTPRIGKPVEIQALWLNALWCAGQTTPEWAELFKKGQESFLEKFWNGTHLSDVVDADHKAGKTDDSFRPNQLLAIGGLPISLLDDDKAKQVMEAAEEKLWTPMGPRSLALADEAYQPQYQGDVHSRDGAYHQGTVWPWLSGPFVEAYVRAHGETKKAKQEATKKFITPLLEHIEQAGMGHLSEIADGNEPHSPRGCPFQAWSVGELLRLQLDVLKLK